MDTVRQEPSTPVGLRAWFTTSPTREIALGLLVAGSYWLLAEFAMWPFNAERRMTPLWGSAGIGVAAAYLGGARLLPAVWVGALLALMPRVPIAVALFGATGAVVEAWLATVLLRRIDFDPRLHRVRDPLVFALVAAPLAAIPFGLFTAVGAWTAGATPIVHAGQSIFQWWARDWLGIVLVGSLCIALSSARPIAWTRGRIVEALSIALLTGLSTQVLLSVWRIFGYQNVPVAFLFFPAVVWVGLRFGARGSTVFCAILAGFAIPLASLGVGPWGGFTVGFSQFLIHAFIMLACLTGLVLAAVMAERDEALERRIGLEEQLRHSQKMEAVGRLAGGIAHDFNNLLTAIIGYTEIVLMGLEPNDPRRSDAEEIGRAAMRAADLTRQMLAFSRRQILQPKVIDLNTALAKVQPMLRRVIGEDIVMTIAPRATEAHVRVDPGQIEQVIMNLVVNARDAMPQGGRLTVETGDATVDDETARLNADAKPGPHVMLAVSDTGVGMPADVKARIFEPYFTTKEIGKGTGLGLSTAYGIVRQSDGHIEVYSEPGLGTTFRIYLPRAEATAAAAAETGEQKMPGGTEHLLLVEDDRSVRRLAREILVRLGYSVTEAASGRAGLALGTDDTRHFDLVLCDVILGDMSGPAVVEALRALRPSIRVVYMSGYTDEAIVRTGVLDEGQPFLQKPFTPAQLAHKIREVIETKDE